MQVLFWQWYVGTGDVKSSCNFTKNSSTPPWVFFTFLKMNKMSQIAQNVSSIAFLFRSTEIISCSLLKTLPLFALTDLRGSTDKNSKKNLLQGIIDCSYLENFENCAEERSAIDFVFQKLTHFNPLVPRVH